MGGKSDHSMKSQEVFVNETFVITSHTAIKEFSKAEIVLCSNFSFAFKPETLRFFSFTVLPDPEFFTAKAWDFSLMFIPFALNLSFGGVTPNL